MKKKLELDQIEIKSFVTSINNKRQEALIGGDKGAKSVLLACSTEANVSECSISVRRDCSQLITNDVITCEGLL